MISWGDIPHHEQCSSKKRLRCRDSNPDLLIQSQMSYHWTTPQYAHLLYHTRSFAKSQAFLNPSSTKSCRQSSNKVWQLFLFDGLPTTFSYLRAQQYFYHHQTGS